MGVFFRFSPGSCVSSVAAGVPATESTPVSRSAYRDPRLMAVTNPMEGRRTPKRMYRSSFSGNKKHVLPRRRSTTLLRLYSCRSMNRNAPDPSVPDESQRKHPLLFRRRESAQGLPLYRILRRPGHCLFVHSPSRRHPHGRIVRGAVVWPALFRHDLPCQMQYVDVIRTWRRCTGRPINSAMYCSMSCWACSVLNRIPGCRV